MPQSKVFVISAVSLVISIIAIALALANFVKFPQTVAGKPSFNVQKDDVTVFSDFTRIGVRNNGSATAHNIQLKIIFAWGGPEVTEFIPELPPDEKVWLSIPIGSEAIGEHRTLLIHITCNEIPTTMTFQIELGTV